MKNLRSRVRHSWSAASRLPGFEHHRPQTQFPPSHRRDRDGTSRVVGGSDGNDVESLPWNCVVLVMFPLSCEVKGHTVMSTATGPGSLHLVAQLCSPAKIPPDAQMILSSNSRTETVPDPQSISAGTCFRTSALWSECFGDLWQVYHQPGDTIPGISNREQDTVMTVKVRKPPCAWVNLASPPSDKYRVVRYPGPS